jgi:hypothetical protein
VLVASVGATLVLELSFAFVVLVVALEVLEAVLAVPPSSVCTPPPHALVVIAVPASRPRMRASIFMFSPRQPRPQSTG